MKLLTGLFIFCSIFSYAQTPFVLTGKVPANLNGDTVKLYSLFTGQKPISSIIQNNKFTFKGTIDDKYQLANIWVTKHNRSIGIVTIVLEPGLNQFVSTQVLPGDKLFKNCLSKWVMLNSQANKIQKQLKEIEDDVFIKMNKSVGDKKGKEIIQEQFKLLTRYPNEPYSMFKLTELSLPLLKNGEKDLPMKTFNLLSQAQKQSELGKNFTHLVNSLTKSYQASKSGNPVPGFTVMTDKGKQFSNQALIGQPYVIAFSATWCLPCQEIQKKLLVLFHKYRIQGLKVIYFNLDNDTVKWKDHIKKNKLDWINASERTKMSNSKIAKMFNVQAIPFYLVIDKNGRIIYNPDELKDDNYNLLESKIRIAVKDVKH